MNFKKKYKFDNTNTLILLTDENNINYWGCLKWQKKNQL